MPDQDRRTADMPDALQAPVIRSIATPALHAGHIEMAVRGIEAAVLRTRTESARESLRRALPDSADFLTADRPSTAGPEGEMQEISFARQRWPTTGSEEKLPGAGVILPAREMQQGRCRRLGVLGTTPAEMRAFAEAGLDEADGRRRCPIALLDAGGDESSVRRDADAVRITQPGGEHLDLIRQGQPQETLIARGDVKAASFVSLQADDEIMAARRGGVAIEKAFVVISFAVPVEVVQPGDLVAPEDEHLTVDDLDAQGLMQTGRIPLPDGPVTRQPLD